jgi:hypothetical protein
MMNGDGEAWVCVCADGAVVYHVKYGPGPRRALLPYGCECHAGLNRAIYGIDFTSGRLLTLIYE